MFISAGKRQKNGKKHTYHRVMEKQRSALGQWVQRQVIYLGELTSDQEESWRRALQVFDPIGNQTQSITLFATPEVVPPEQLNSVAIRLNQIKLHRPRSYGDCWLGCQLWRQLQLDQFWHSRLRADGRSGVQWQKVLALLVVNRLIAPGSEFRLHRQWFNGPGAGPVDLIGTTFAKSPGYPQRPGIGPVPSRTAAAARRDSYLRKC